MELVVSWCDGIRVLWLMFELLFVRVKGVVVDILILKVVIEKFVIFWVDKLFLVVVMLIYCMMFVVFLVIVKIWGMIVEEEGKE